MTKGPWWDVMRIGIGRISKIATIYNLMTYLGKVWVRTSVFFVTIWLFFFQFAMENHHHAMKRTVNHGKPSISIRAIMGHHFPWRTVQHRHPSGPSAFGTTSPDQGGWV